MASPCVSRPRVHFNDVAECLLFTRGLGCDKLPKDGGVSLSLDGFVSIHYEPLSLSVEDARGVSTPRRHPARRREELLSTLSSQEREALLVAHCSVEAMQESLQENRSIVHTHLLQSKFCDCVDGCKEGSCSCVADGIGCHHEGPSGCRCRKSCSNPLGLARYDAVLLRRERKRALVEYTKRENSAPSTPACTPQPATRAATPTSTSTSTSSSVARSDSSKLSPLNSRASSPVPSPRSTPSPVPTPHPHPAPNVTPLRSSPRVARPPPTPHVRVSVIHFDDDEDEKMVVDTASPRRSPRARARRTSRSTWT